MRMCRVLLLVVIVMSMFCVTAFAITQYGDFSYWYSDSSSVAYHDLSSIKVQVGKTSGFGLASSSFSTYAGNATSTWLDSVEVPFTYVTSSPNIFIKGITRAEAVNLGLSNTVLGNTQSSGTLIGYASYNGATKKVYKLSSPVTIYIIWDEEGDGQTSKLPPLSWKQLISHEFGHAVGYKGHYNATSGASMMYNSSSLVFGQSITSPSSNDLKQIQNVY